jgi:serine/threonine-protein kinase
VSARNAAVPEGLDAWVASMTEKDRELRPESASEARRDLFSEAATLPPAAPLAELVAAPPDPGDEPKDEKMSAAPFPGADTVTISRATSRRSRRRGRTVAVVLPLVLGLLAAAWGAWTYLVPHTVSVPRLVGAEMTAAERRLSDLGLTARTAKGHYSRTVPAGHVVRTQPAPGTDVDGGSAVTLVPSLGPPPVEVPDVLGKTVDQARTLLEGAHLKLGRVTPRFSARFDEGRIAKVAAGASEPWGSAIDVWVSKGPRPVPVPKVVGKTLDDAHRLLDAWNVTVVQKFSDTVPRDHVISTQPRAGTELQPGQSLTVVVSLGPQTFAMPSVVGMSKDAATAELRALGLKVGYTPIPGSNADTVVSTLPTAGTTVRYGQTVTLFVA